jgi:hypothetical protein
MKEERPEDSRKANPAEKVMSPSQEDKAVAESASQAGEEKAARSGDARPADPMLPYLPPPAGVHAALS